MYSWLESSTPTPYEQYLSLEIVVPLFCAAIKGRTAFPTPCLSLCISPRPLDGEMTLKKSQFFIWA